MTRRDLEQRLANTTWSRPPSDVPLAKCWCGGAYMDTGLGADAHEVVMGHRPSARDPTTDTTTTKATMQGSDTCGSR